MHINSRTTLLRSLEVVITFPGICIYMDAICVVPRRFNVLQSKVKSQIETQSHKMGEDCVIHNTNMHTLSSQCLIHL